MSMMIKNKTCRMCNGTAFKTVINFGANALVNGLVEKKYLKDKNPVFPLVVKRCQRCSLVQIKDIVNSDAIYRDIDYVYFSGDMPGLSDYFGAFADDMKKRFLSSGDFVAEIGSNDGLMLGKFQDQRVLGIDPSTNVAVRALKHNVPTISDFFTERLARTIKQEFGEAALVYGNNCLAHLNDLRDVMAGVSLLLKEGGIFAVECNYWGEMVKTRNYALIYHDHYSYYSLKNWVDFAKRYGMNVFDGVVTSAQGGTLRVFMKKGKAEMTSRCRSLYDEEIKTKLNTQASADAYRRGVLAEAKKLSRLVSGLKKEGKRIACYGAAAKGFSVLKLAHIDQRHIDYFIDDSPAKQGKYTPVTHIPIISRDQAQKRLPDYFIITAPNHAAYIIGKEDAFRASGGKFITADSQVM